ncbi:M42 family metallopeptidase [Dolosicoccus paucivorans]|uniref:M42 family metallopeptidase n=1 Tax=Dolosicoccus paucivorans TaxID=84521 RepID=UPI000B89A355|nr:M42 family metallopeptidase [Dolosicoccus paucivorans]
MEINMDLLKRITEVNGIAGHEGQVRELFKEETKDYVDDFLQDGLGGIFGHSVGNEEGPRLMLAAHMDEVGFMVQQITKEGFLHFIPIGGWWNQVLLSQQVEVTTREGKTYRGVIGSKPPHILKPDERKQPMDISNMFIDLGASSKEEVEAWGIRQGDMITPYIKTERLNDTPYLLGKAWDDRIGVAVAIEVLKYAHTHGHDNILYAGANVQEEVGLRGAKGATYSINPDISLALDTGIAGDTPGITEKEAASHLGKGVQILFFDSSMIPHRGLRDFVIDLAEKENIPYQLDSVVGGGTDAGSQHQSLGGVPSLAIGIPVRYLHTHGSVIHEDDFKSYVRLATAIVKHLDKKAYEQIIQNG